ncbi:hypothetical protein H1R20_g2456, partial [Candolleomyces eurysporus]
MGYTNSQQVQHGDLTFLLQDEIPHVTLPFVDDVPVKGPPTRYELPGGGYETIPENPGIRRFVWEHMNDVLRVVWRIHKAGGTFSGPKAHIYRVQKIRDWPIPRDLTSVRRFLGTVGTLRMFIKNYAVHSEPLVKLTRRKTEFVFGPTELEAMEKIKYLVTTCPAIRPIDYSSDNEVILAVDSSQIAVGYILSQMGDDGLRYPSRFGSITWNERERRYSQSKIELFGLFRALKDVRIYIIAVKRLVVEVDARYIKGMINNPDIQPNATINRWIAGVLLFDFELRHVPAHCHVAADGLSRRERSPNDPEDQDDYDEWIDSANVFSMEVLNRGRQNLNLRSTPGFSHPRNTNSLNHAILSIGVQELEIPRSSKAIERDRLIEDIRTYLDTLRRPSGLTEDEYKKFIRYAFDFFVMDGKLFRKDRHQRHQVVIPPGRCLSILRQAHDNLGHKGVFTVSSRLLARFWWPHLLDDVKWYVKSCHECQIRNAHRYHIPPTVPTPFSLFRKIYIDTMFLPPSHGFTCIVHTRCSLSSYPEWRMLRTENARSLGSFIFEDILRWYGMIEEIVTDNGPPYVAAIGYLKECYGIPNIRISPYNSQANGPVERRHYDVREALMKATERNESQWPIVAPSVFWAKRVTIQKSTGYSPYYIVHGIELIFPFDLTEATFIAPPIDSTISTEDLIARRAIQLQKRPEDLQQIKDTLHKSRIASAQDFERRFANSIKYSRSGSQLNAGLVDRWKIKTTLDGSISKLCFAAYRLIPYTPRNVKKIPVTRITRLDGETLDSMTRDRE